MTHSCHSHSGQFCCHATGSLESSVREALRQGFRTYGLSEHVPRYSDRDLYPEEREAAVSTADLASRFEAYLQEAHRLKTAYADRITLVVGAESEYIDDETLERHCDLLLQDPRVEYVVGSVHHCDGRPIDFDQKTFGDAVQETGLPQLLETYFNNQYRLIRQLKPTVIGHFDLCRLYYPQTDLRTGFGGALWPLIERNIRAAVAQGAAFELNAAAFRKGWDTAYPGRDVLECIIEHRGKLTLSDDSHGPHQVGLNYHRLYEYLSKMGVEELYELDEHGALVKVHGTPWKDEWLKLDHPRTE